MKHYKLEELETLCRQENSSLTDEEIRQKAKQLHAQLNVLDVRWRRSNRRFYQMTSRYESPIKGG
ncbi:MAG: hypothetical protein E6X17_09785 [Sporomusaceae bacterium]|nr:hypothetical protein [Sporomusaceae bacterium]